MEKNLLKLMLTVLLGILLTGCASTEESGSNQGTEKEQSAESNEDKGESPAETSGDPGSEQPQAEAVLKDVEDKTVGTVQFLDRGDHIQILANIEGLTPGHHGFHIHEKGVCEADAKEGPFTTAGGHFNPDGKKHPDHAGDLPSLYVKEDGKADYSGTIDRLTLDQLKNEELSVVVHANPDNFGNIPDRYESEGGAGPDEETAKAGDAGDREACGVITTEKE